MTTPATETVVRPGLGRSRTYPRSEIRAVTWAKGCPVAVQLADGRWVRLPEVGSSSQGVVYTIRAWLKRGSGAVG